MKKIFIIFLIIAGIYILFNSINNSSWLPFSKKSSEAEVTNRVDTIEFDISAVNLTVIPEDRNTVEANLEGKGKVNVNRSGDTIKVDYKHSWFSWFSFFNETKLTVFIPEDYEKDMLIDMSAGNLVFSGDSKDEPMKLDTLTLDMSAGNVELENLSVTNFVHDGAAGNVTMNSLASKSSSFDMSAGNVKVKEFTGELDVDMSAGKFDIQMEELKDDVNIDMSAGTALLDIPEDADFTLDASLSAGDISYDFPLEIKQEDKRNVKGTHGSGTHKINIDMSSGTAKIE